MNRPRNTYGTPWLFLTLSLALHVFDEAANDFLSFYNPLVMAIRDRVPWLIFPTFTFRIWITGLCIGVAILLLLSPLAYRGSRKLRPLAYFFAILMILNGLQHIAGSLYLHRFVAGVYSSPVLVIAAVSLLLALFRSRLTPGENLANNLY